MKFHAKKPNGAIRDRLPLNCISLLLILTAVLVAQANRCRAQAPPESRSHKSDSQESGSSDAFGISRHRKPAGPPQFAKQSTGILVVDNFESPIQNQLGGFRNPFQKRPSTATFHRTRKIGDQEGTRGYSLCISGDRKPNGWCGAWIHLFDHEKTPNAWFDASRFDYLSIWIRGEKGGEQVCIKISDKFWYELEDSWAVARTSHCLPQGITRQWQEIRIPIASMRRINPAKLATIVFDFEKPGRHTIYVDDISFRTEAGIDQALPQVKYSPRCDRHPPKSLWVWQTEKLLNNTHQRRNLFEFCVRNNIQTLWLQMLYRLENNKGSKRVDIQFPRQFRRFNSEAHAYGLKVHALDGYPEYALREWQHVPLLLTQAIAEFNQQGNGNERLDGIHFDNEPHLLVGWHSPAHRRQILAEFLSLNQRCQEIAKQAGVKYGIDIPFWWEEKDPLTGRPCGEVHFRGVSKPASFHCIDMLDNVGVMNYRDMADGADGMIAHGRALLEYAQEHGDCDMFMGVETFAYPLQRVEFLCGVRRKEFYRLLDGPARRLGRMSRIHNYRIRVFDDGEFIHVGLEHPEDPARFDPGLFQKGLGEIATRLQLTPAGERKVWAPFLQSLNSSGEYRDAVHRLVLLNGQQFNSVTATAFMSPKITFADQTLEEFQLQARLACDFFSRFSKFRGLAIHCYDTFRRMKSATAGRSPDQR